MERFQKQVLDESDYMATVKLATTVRNIIKIFLMPVAFWVACVIAVYKWTWKTIGW